MDDDFDDEFSLFKDEFVGLTVDMSVTLWLDGDGKVEIRVSLGEDGAIDDND